MRHKFDEALDLQYLQHVPHRGSRDAKLVAQFHLRETLARSPPVQNEITPDVRQDLLVYRLLGNDTSPPCAARLLSRVPNVDELRTKCHERTPLTWQSLPLGGFPIPREGIACVVDGSRLI